MIEENIDTLIITSRKISPIIIVYVMIIIIMFLSLITIFIFYHYKTYYRIRGHIVSKDEEFMIELYVPLDKEKYLTVGNTFLIDKKKYQIEKIIFEPEYLSDDITTYQLAVIKTNLPSKYKINNLTLSLKILKEDKLVIDYFIKK